MLTELTSGYLDHLRPLKVHLGGRREPRGNQLEPLHLQMNPVGTSLNPSNGEPPYTKPGAYV